MIQTILLLVAVWGSSLPLAACACPEEKSIYYCDNPVIVLPDPAIHCDAVTCQWDLDLFDPANTPQACASIKLNDREIDSLPDLLEPCLWWEMLYGKLTALQPHFTEYPSSGPSSAPSLAPTDIGM
jgi:hypothetical protein